MWQLCFELRIFLSNLALAFLLAFRSSLLDIPFAVPSNISLSISTDIGHS